MVIVLPPAFLHAIVNVRIVVPILCQAVVDQDGVQLIRSLLVFDVRRRHDLLEFADFNLQSLDFGGSGFFVFFEHFKRDLDFILLKIHIGVVQLIRCQVDELFLVLALLLNANADFILNDSLLLLNAFREYLVALLELLGHVVVFGVLIEHVLQLLQGFLELFDLFSMCFGLLFVLVQEQVEINGLVKVEPAIILDQLLLLDVKIDPVQLEEHDVGRAADPGLQNFRLALNVASEAFDFRSAAALPRLIQIALVDAKLNRAKLVNILIGDSFGAVRVNRARELHLASQEILPDGVLEIVETVVH